MSSEARKLNLECACSQLEKAVKSVVRDILIQHALTYIY